MNPSMNSIEMTNLNVFHNRSQLLYDITTVIPTNAVTTLIGPSGAGKSTLIRTMNRINDESEGYKTTGAIFYEGTDIKSCKPFELRKSIGMIFQKPCVFPKSIFENVIFGIKHHNPTADFNRIVEETLKAVSLYEEVKNRLHEPATTLSIGQQQRLCIARALAVKPHVILMDEPTSALDPISTLAIESLITKLKEQYTIIVVTHNIDQAKRISDQVVFLNDGRIVEQGPAKAFFAKPEQEATQQYISWQMVDN